MSESQTKELSGIRGWLAFYVWFTLIYSGFYAAISVLELAQGRLGLNELIGIFPYYPLIVRLFYLFNVFIAILLLIQLPRAVSYTKSYLVIKVFYWVILSVVVIAQSGLKAWGVAASFGFYALLNFLWYEYFSRSLRVKNTYLK